MKKILMREYGSEDVLFEANENIPSITASQILIKMVAASINNIDTVIRKQGLPASVPAELQPKFPHLLGQDFSGIVTQIGENVTEFQVGDHVIGITFTGTYSEYIAVDEASYVAKVPNDLDLIPLGGLGVVSSTAWRSVIGHGQVKPNQRVLIHGGAGGVGSMAIQHAKNAGAYVITTATESNKDFLKELGADEIIDYTTVNFEEVIHDIDLVIDTVGGITQDKSYRVMKSSGKMFSTAQVPDQKKAVEYGVEAQYISSDIRTETLHSIINLYTEKKLIVRVNKIYPFTLDGIKTSHKDFENGPNNGKRIISFNK